MNAIYLDHAATTPTDPRVVEAMLPYFMENYGNPLSTHRFGHKAEAALNKARQTIADILNCAPHEIIFTSGGTESDNLALRGSVIAARKEGKRRYVLRLRCSPHCLQRSHRFGNKWGRCGYQKRVGR